MKTRIFLDLPNELASKQPVILFDGECSLCSSSVGFLIKYNQSGNLNFASLQSEIGSKVLKLAGKTLKQNDTLFLIQDNILYGYSTAALKITGNLCLPWRLLGIFILVPVIIRDYIYKIIAGNRYKWFGRESFCMTDKLFDQKRFLT
jgi:predicted DCC family thiol-disulfide oxidoreductase YuxK